MSLARWMLALAPAGLLLGSGPGASLAQSTEHVVVSPDGQLEALSFGRRACVRVMLEGRQLADLTCVDLAQPGDGVLRLVVDGRTLEVPYRTELSLGRTDYLIRLGTGWAVGPAPAPTPAPGCAQSACLVRGALPLPVLPEVLPQGGGVPPALPRAVPSVALEPLPHADEHAARPGGMSAGPPRGPGEAQAPSAPQTIPSGTPEAAGGHRSTGERPAAEPAEPEALAYARFTLRQGERGAQLSYTLLARAPLETPAAALRLYLDGQPLRARLTRRGLGPVPGRLEAGDGEWGWLDLPRLEGAVLRLEWALSSGVLRREWRLR